MLSYYHLKIGGKDYNLIKANIPLTYLSINNNHKFHVYVSTDKIQKERMELKLA